MEDRAGMGTGNSGEKTLKGLAGGHGYSVMGVEKRGERRYIRLRNPWGDTAREYVVKPDQTMDAKAVEDISTCGIFLVEINDFAVNFQSITAA